AEVVAVRIRVQRVGAEQHLGGIGESVPIGVVQVVGRIEGIGAVDVDLGAVVDAAVVGVGVVRVGGVDQDLVAVGEGVAVGVRIERIGERRIDLGAVVEVVVVGVRIQRIG